MHTGRDSRDRRFPQEKTGENVINPWVLVNLEEMLKPVALWPGKVVASGGRPGTVLFLAGVRRMGPGLAGWGCSRSGWQGHPRGAKKKLSAAFHICLPLRVGARRRQESSPSGSRPAGSPGACPAPASDPQVLSQCPLDYQTPGPWILGSCLSPDWREAGGEMGGRMGSGPSRLDPA